MKNMVPSQDLNGGFSYHYSFNYNHNHNPTSRRRRRYRENLGMMNDRFQGYNNIPLMAELEEEEEDESNNETNPMGQVQDKEWLRLSIGGDDVDTDHHRQPQPKTKPSTSILQLSTPPLISPNPHPHLNWGFRPTHNLGIGIGIGNSSNSFIPYFSSTPFQINSTTGLVDLVNTAAGPSSDTITLIDPPPRPHSGIWFTLQPFLNQGKQAILRLPHRSSSSTYLRIKDGRMTVRLLIKYLVNKLRLDSESQVEIRCRGEKLEPCLTMQHIRDNIWCSKEKETMNNITLLPHSSTIDHIMLLHYLATTTSPPSN